MADDERARTSNERKIDKAQRTTDEARAIIDAEGSAHRTKTARLREERLVREAAEEAAKAKAAKKLKAAKKPAARKKAPK